MDFDYSTVGPIADLLNENISLTTDADVDISASMNAIRDGKPMPPDAPKPVVKADNFQTPVTKKADDWEETIETPLAKAATEAPRVHGAYGRVSAFDKSDTERELEYRLSDAMDALMEVGLTREAAHAKVYGARQ